MSAQPANLPDAMAIEPAAPRVTPRGNAKLAQLHAAYVDAKAAADQAAKDLKAITDAIKLALNEAHPENTKVDLMPATGVTAPPLRLSYVESWRLDSRRMKTEDPETYVRYAKKSGSWRLEALRPEDGDS